MAKTPLDSHKPSTPDSHRGSLHLAERQEMTDQAEFVPEIHYTEKFLRIGNDEEIWTRNEAVAATFHAEQAEFIESEEVGHHRVTHPQAVVYLQLCQGVPVSYWKIKLTCN